MSSIDSLGNAEAALQEAMELDAGINRLARMAAVDAMATDLQNESKAAAQDIEIHQRELWGGDAVDSATTAPEDDMKVMAARDVIVNQQPAQVPPPPASPTSPAAPQPPAPTSPDKQPTELWQKVLALGLGAAGLGIGAGVPLVAYNLTKPTPAVQPASDSDTKYSLGIFRPDAATPPQQ
jgi:hypothetical protein